MTVTLAIEERLLDRARRLAHSRGISLDQLVRSLLEEATGANAEETLLEDLERSWAEEATQPVQPQLQATDDS